MIGFTLPSLFGYSTFSIWAFYVNGFPNKKNGTKYYCLEIAIGPPKWKLLFDIKLDFWNPKNMDGWIIRETENGTETIHSSRL